MTTTTNYLVHNLVDFQPEAFSAFEDVMDELECAINKLAAVSFHSLSLSKNCRKILFNIDRSLESKRATGMLIKQTIGTPGAHNSHIIKMFNAFQETCRENAEEFYALVQQVCDIQRRLLERGVLSGAALDPPSIELIKKFGAPQETLRKAIDRLSDSRRVIVSGPPEAPLEALLGTLSDPIRALLDEESPQKAACELICNLIDNQQVIIRPIPKRPDPIQQDPDDLVEQFEGLEEPYESPFI